MSGRLKTRGVKGLLPWAVVATLVIGACTDAISPPAPPLFSFSPNGITPSKANGALNQVGRRMQKGFDPENPHHGDAIIATVFWLGSTYIVDSVIDNLNDFTPVGNKYNLVEYVTTGGRSMATYVATNVRNFPDADRTRILVVRAYLSDSVEDGGITISAWGGVEDNFATAVSGSSSTFGSDTGSIPASAEPIAVDAGGFVYTVTMGALQEGSFTGLGTPDGYTSIGRGSDNFILEDAAYAVQASAGTVDPQWTWLYGSPPRPWLVSTLSLRAAPPPDAPPPPPPPPPPPNSPPVVDAGPDETALTGLLYNFTWSFGDGNHDGPWSYTINWGDGTTSTGSVSSEGSFTAGHTYVILLPRDFTITVTVRDASGASGTDTKVVRVVLL